MSATTISFHLFLLRPHTTEVLMLHNSIANLINYTISNLLHGLFRRFSGGFKRSGVHEECKFNVTLTLRHTHSAHSHADIDMNRTNAMLRVLNSMSRMRHKAGSCHVCDINLRIHRKICICHTALIIMYCHRCKC